ncbi:DUF3892 domain-containing protein [Asticcacaulis sp. AC466]|uniref:DUF3892 domain-containing protein n=1 Tax=Asticcacaulis sp. AC466 TaxID=1282362 RepID=UPI0009DCCB1B
MADYRVTWIRRDGNDMDRRIDRLGGPGWDGGSIDQVIAWIRSGHRFWTSVNNVSVWIAIKRHPTSGRDYLATEPDSYPANNLLSLPDCPQ